VAVVEIDVVDAETLERLVAGFPNIVRVIADYARAVWSDRDGEFGGEEDVIALAGSLEPSVVLGRRLLATSSEKGAAAPRRVWYR
jgi:hypothetical protein